MAEHICHRDNCPPNNIKGPKTTCAKCNKLAYLLCHGFDSHGNDFVKFKLPNGSKFIAASSSFTWLCQNCETAGFIVTAKGAMTPNASTTPSRAASQKPTANNFEKAIMKQLVELKNSIDEKIVNRLDEFGKGMCAVGNVTVSLERKLDWHLEKQGTQNARDLAKEMFRPAGNSNGMPRAYHDQTPKTATPKKSSYSTVLQKSLAVTPKPTTTTSSNSSAMSLKRKRNTELLLIDNSSSQMVQKTKIPTPKQGTKNIQIGKPLELRKIEPKKINALSKSIWVSGFHPETTTEELDEHIITNTEVKEKTKFRCSKLVKKEQDTSKMTFVSFKIDVSPEDYDTIANPEVWPHSINIREFIKMTPPKPTLGQFLAKSSSDDPSSPQNAAKLQKSTLR